MSTENNNDKTARLDIESGATSIYEGGTLSKITTDDLINNSTAIRQLINEHNLSVIKVEKLETQIQTYKSHIEYLKTSPFISIFSAILSVVGSSLLAISVNLLTGSQNSNIIYNILLILSVVIILSSSLMNILYPYARDWFNKEKKIQGK